VNGATLYARCDHVNEATDEQCSGQLMFWWGVTQAACDKCGAWCGISVAHWTEVR
jgi:hypothetical protein